MDTDLHRFVAAQDKGGTYAAALAELRAGQKRTHWMWYVFPQLAGLGRSKDAQRFALSGPAEASAYLAHPVLGPRLLECCHALLDLGHGDAHAVLDSPDDLKLRSSMTLFAAAAGGHAAQEVFEAVLQRFYGGEPDQRTIDLLVPPTPA